MVPSVRSIRLPPIVKGKAVDGERGRTGMSGLPSAALRVHNNKVSGGHGMGRVVWAGECNWGQ